jgi:hypothetical protein
VVKRRGRREDIPSPATFPTWAAGATITITGIPRTKKNNSVMVNATTIIPSRAWREWARLAEIRVAPGPLTGYIGTPPPPPGFGLLFGVRGTWVWAAGVVRAMLPSIPYNCRALVFRDREVGDAVGFYQAIGDLLQQRGVLANDRFIRQWDGSRLQKDANRPRVELELSPIVDGQENAPAHRTGAPLHESPGKMGANSASFR